MEVKMNILINEVSNLPPLVLFCGNKLTICGSRNEAHEWLKRTHMRRSSAYVLYDPCGTLFNLYGNSFLRYGYEIKIFDATICRTGARYNPFEYVRGENGAAKLAEAVISGTKGIETYDEDFIAAERLLLTALIGYIREHALSEEQNFGTVCEMLKNMESVKDEDAYKTVVDMVFESVGESWNYDFSCRLYKQFKATPYGKDRRLVNSCIERLAPLITKQALNFMSADELSLNTLSYGKTALFVRGLYSCSELDFLVPLIYSQIFDLLYKEING
jgi:type IV secretion system protein VirD4